MKYLLILLIISIVLLCMYNNYDFNKRENFMGFLNRSDDILFNDSDLYFKEEDNKLKEAKKKELLTQQSKPDLMEQLLNTSLPNQNIDSESASSGIIENQLNNNDVIAEMITEENNNKVLLNHGKKQPNNAVPIEKQNYQINLQENACKFFNNFTCSAEYPVFTGASLGLLGDNNISMQCDNGEDIKLAKIVVTISNGSIEDVHILEPGFGYENSPKIIVNGDGEGAKLIANVRDKQIESIKILNNGINYKNTPEIIIEKPKLSNKCYLCCKKHEQ